MAPNGSFETGTSCGPLFGTQLMSLWMKQASLEKTWVTSMLKGILLILSLNLNTSSVSCVINDPFVLIYNITWFFLDGCLEWRRTSRRLMCTTDLWMEMVTSTGGLSLALNTCLQNSCALSQGKWVRSSIKKKMSYQFNLWWRTAGNQWLVWHLSLFRSISGIWTKLNSEFLLNWSFRYGTMTSSRWMTI